MGNNQNASLSPGRSQLRQIRNNAGIKAIRDTGQLRFVAQQDIGEIDRDFGVIQTRPTLVAFGSLLCC